MKKNILFISKCILALLPFLAAMLFTAVFPFGYMDREYPAWKYTKEISSGKLSGVTTVILGDSRAMADLIPDILDSEDISNTAGAINLSDFSDPSKVSSAASITYNLAVGGATPIEMYYTLNRMIKNGTTPDRVIIMFAPFHYSIIDNYVTRTEYFNYLSLKEWSELVDCARAAGSEAVLRDGYFDDMLSCRLRFPNKYLPALFNAKAVTRYNENKNEYDSIINSRGHGLFGTDNGSSDLNFETTYEFMHISGDAVLVQLYMNKLLRLCSENNINTLVTIPPMNEASYNSLNPTYVEDFTDYLSELSFSYPEIKIYKEIPHLDDMYFGDSSHLNADGAALFSKQFKEKYYE